MLAKWKGKRISKVLKSDLSGPRLSRENWQMSDEQNIQQCPFGIFILSCGVIFFYLSRIRFATPQPCSSVLT